MLSDPESKKSKDSLEGKDRNVWPLGGRVSSARLRRERRGLCSTLGS